MSAFTSKRTNNMKKLIASIALSYAIVGCGGVASSGSNSGFNITSVTPSNDSTIPVSQAFIANFSNNVDSATIGNVALATESGANVLLSCASASVTSIICTPTTQLNYATKYILTYGSGIKNTAGNSLNQTIYNYTTFSNQGVASILPGSGAISPNTTTWNIVFGESMQLATLNTSQTPGNVTLTQTTTSSPINVPITCTSIDPTNMSCTVSQSQLALNEPHVLTLTNKIISQNSVPITLQTVNYTTSNYVTPTVTVNPVAGAVGLNQLSYALTFNTTMQSTTVNSHVVMTDTTSSSKINTNCTSSDNIVFTCALQSISQLAPNHNYTLALESGMLSTQNIGLAPVSFNYSATNYTQPSINFVTPPSGAVSLNQINYNIQFNVAMDMSTFTGNVIFMDTTSANAIPINCTSNDNINVSCILSGVSQLTPGDNYTLSFGSGIKSQEQVPLVDTAYSYAATNYTVPTIQYVNPTAGAIALTQTTFTTKFNTDMDMSTFTGNVNFRDTTAGSNLTIACTSSDNINVQCALQGVSQLTFNHNYTLTFSNGIKSLQGIAVTTTSYNYAATVFTTPHIVNINPTPGAISLTQLTFTPQFSESMNMSTFSGNVTMTDSTTGSNIAVSCASTDKITIICILSGVSQLTYNHNYALNLGAGITSMLGVPISSTTYNYSASNATIPQVVTLSPTANTQLKAGINTFVITFNTAISTSTLNNTNITLTDTSAGINIPLMCTVNGSTSVSCSANNMFDDDNFVLTLTSAIQSTLGVPMNQVSYNYHTALITYSWANVLNGVNVVDKSNNNVIYAYYGQNSNNGSLTMNLKYTNNSNQFVSYPSASPLNSGVTSGAIYMSNNNVYAGTVNSSIYGVYLNSHGNVSNLTAGLIPEVNNPNSFHELNDGSVIFINNPYGTGNNLLRLINNTPTNIAFNLSNLYITSGATDGTTIYASASTLRGTASSIWRLSGSVWYDITYNLPSKSYSIIYTGNKLFAFTNVGADSKFYYLNNTTWVALNSFPANFILQTNNTTPNNYIYAEGNYVYIPGSISGAQVLYKYNLTSGKLTNLINQSFTDGSKITSATMKNSLLYVATNGGIINPNASKLWIGTPQ